MYKNLFLLLVLLVYSGHIAAQLTGMPKIENFKTEYYKADTRNWAVEQSSDGKVYFANHHGLLEYDGASWNVITEPDNRSSIRSLAIDKWDRIYIGAQGEIGYIDKNSDGTFSYQSLNAKIPSKSRDYDIVKKIIIADDGTYFLSKAAVYKYANDTISVINPGSEWDFIGEFNDTLYVADIFGGLFKISDHGVKKDPKADIFKNKLIRFILPHPDFNKLIGTVDNGIYYYNGKKYIPWEKEATYYLKQYSVHGGKMLSNGYYAVYTDDGGIIVFDETGKVMYHVSSEYGLQTNGVTDICEDHSHNLWLALYNGVSYIELSTPLTILGKYNGIGGAVLSSIFYKNRLYVATNSGLYYASISDIENEKLYHKTFKCIKNGHCWMLKIINGELLLGHHTGLYRIEDEKVSQLVHSYNGAWELKHFPNDTTKLLMGTYSGLFVIDNKEREWKLRHKIKGFNLTARQFTFDNSGKLWLVLSVKGIYRLELDKATDSITNLRYYDEEDGLPGTFYNNLAIIDGRIYFGTKNGLYAYDEGTDSFRKSDKYDDIFEDVGYLRKVIQLPNKNLVFINGLNNKGEIGIYFRKRLPHIDEQVQKLDYLRGKLLYPFENFYLLDDNKILIGGREGLMIYDAARYRNKSTSYFCNLSKVVFTKTNDSLLYGQNSLFPYNTKATTCSKYLDGVPEIPYSLNALRFIYAAAFFEMSNYNVYQTYLEGYDEKWTDWNSLTSREFTNLKEGMYTFRIRAKNVYNVISNEVEYKFEILPPWYRSKWMYFIYITLVIFSIYLFIRVKNKQFKMAVSSVESNKVKVEKDMLAFQNEELKKEYESQSNELASSTIHIASLNEIMRNLKEKIQSFQKLENTELKQAVKQLNTEIESSLDSNISWENFEHLFNQINSDYLKRLKERFPELNPRDIRLCTYLRMNMTSKEIAPLMGVSYRGIESLRYRLRKKLHLEKTDSLTEFILNF